MKALAIAVLFLASSGSQAASKERHPLRLAVGQEAGSCYVEWQSERVTLDALEAKASTWPDKKSDVHIVGGPETPYRCMGGVIYLLQRAGFKRVGFVAEPPPAR